MALNVFSLVCLIQIVDVFGGSRPQYEIPNYYNFVYTAEHFDNLACPSDDYPEMVKHTFIELYTPECATEATNGWHQDWQHLMPPPQNVLFVRYDYKETPTLVWYTEKDHLYERYPPVNCSTIYFIPKGAQKAGNALRWVPEDGKSFIDWAWDQVKVNITINNDSPNTKYVQFLTQRNAPEPMRRIGPGRKAVLLAYPSDYMIVYDDSEGDDFCGGRVINEQETYVLDDKFSDNKNDISVHWQKRAAEDEKERAELVIILLWSHGERQLINLKQPLIVPNFTATGYGKQKTPPEIQKMLIDHYNEFKNKRIIENFEVTDSAINIDARYTSFVDLAWNETLKSIINKLMLPYVEKWCNCKLKPEMHYGIREYYTGHVLRMHVDRVSTHIISVIFQVYRNLNGEPDWPIEVIKYDGTRSNVYLESGEMLYYESAKLIHGRPEKFKGKVYANSFLHYVPIKPVWPFKRIGNTLQHTVLNAVEHIDLLKSPLTEEKNIFRTTRDEL